MNYIKLNENDTAEIQRMSDMATAILREHYDPIVGEEQNSYMLNLFQSYSAIENQLRHGYRYYFVNDGDRTAGFLAFYPKDGEMYLSKFYLLKNMRGKGYARDMLDFVIGEARKCGFSSISLNVNQHNETVSIYERLGFRRVRAEVNDLGNGYFVDDYVYRYFIS